MSTKIFDEFCRHCRIKDCKLCKISYYGKFRGKLLRDISIQNSHNLKRETKTREEYEFRQQARTQKTLLLEGEMP